MVKPDIYGLWSVEKEENKNIYKKDLDSSSLKFVIESSQENKEVYVFIDGDYITHTSEFIKRDIEDPDKISKKVMKEEATTKKGIKEILEDFGFDRL